jgi:hypothetical protein
MFDNRGMWAILGSVFLLAGGPLLIAGQAPYPRWSFWVCWVLVVGGFVVFVALIFGRRLPGANRAYKPEVAVTHLNSWGEMHADSMPTLEETRWGKQGLIEMIVKCRLAIPPESHFVEVRSAMIQVSLDAVHAQTCEGNVSHWVERFGETTVFPEGYSRPPKVRHDLSIEIRCGFYLNAWRDSYTKGWVVPHDCEIKKLVLTDMLGHKHRAKDVEGKIFNVNWLEGPHRHHG